MVPERLRYFVDDQEVTRHEYERLVRMANATQNG